MKIEYARIAIAAVCVIATARQAPAGPLWDEDLTTDAGSLPATAQPVPVDVRIIRGKTGGSALAGSDTEDMYLITIQAPMIFCMRTVPLGETLDCCGNQLFPLQVDQGTNFNTQLFVFDSTGLGLLANDDESDTSTLSSMGNVATDRGPPFEIIAPGQYHIAVSGGPGNDPFSAGGAIFSQDVVTEVSRPDGPGNAQVIIGWNGGGRTGDYEIVLCGASMVEGVPAVSTWLLVVLTGVMLAAGGIFIRRQAA
jgi:hypothetical protein